MRRKSWGLGVAMLGALQGGCSGNAVDDVLEQGTTKSQADALYYVSDNVWPDPSISVCFNSSAGATERGWVRDAVEAAFEPFSQVDFTGWGVCGSAGAEIVIDWSNNVWSNWHGAPRSADVTDNMALTRFTGAARDLDGDGKTDFSGCWTDSPGAMNPHAGITRRQWSSNHRRCVEVGAVHEFFHALGAAHEQNRDDTPSFCTQPDDGWGDTKYGYWDVTSVSNYCNPAWDGDGYPSQLDYSGLGKLYGLVSNDQTWYGIGNVRDYGGVPQDRLLFAQRPEEVTGTYTPVIGDFDKSGTSDLLLYAPNGTDYLWFGRTDRDWDETTVTADGGYTPVAGDFDGDGADDIFWYAPGSATDRLWFGRSDRTFDKITPNNVTGTYTKPLVGDFDGDGFADIFWYAAGSGVDKISFGRADRTFDNVTPTNVTGSSYQPFVGNFDGDTQDDIFWYAPGVASDMIWFGRTARTFTQLNVDVSGVYKPAAGDFDNDGVTDVLWSQDGNLDPVELYSTTRGVVTNTYTSSILGSGNAFSPESTPYAGDFDGDGWADVFWYKPN